MILTITYILYTTLRLRATQKYKAKVREAFEVYYKLNAYTIMFYPTYFSSDDKKGDEDALTSWLCPRIVRPQLKMATIFGTNISMYGIYPQQEISISSWLEHPYKLEKTDHFCFPLDISIKGKYWSTKSDDPTFVPRKSDDCIYILIETDITTYHKDTLEHCIKIEDYGIIRAWTLRRDLNLLLETDIDHITNLATMFIQGQYWMNNCLFIKRLETVAINGKPCKLTPIEIYKEVQDRELFVQVSQTAETTVGSQMPQLRIFRYPKNPNIVIEIANKNDIKSQGDPYDFMKTEEYLHEQDVKKEINKVMSFAITPVNSLVALSKNKTSSEESCKKSSKEFSKKSSEEPLKKFSEESLKKCSKESSEEPSKKSSEESSKVSDEDNVIVKPPNVLIYSDSTQVGKNVKALLSKMLDPESYTIYNLSSVDAPKDTWIDQVALVVVCGNVKKGVADRFIDYIERGGKLLVLCSNMLRMLLPIFKTAELLENQLANFSYGNCKGVRMMHDIFCYRSSSNKDFSPIPIPEEFNHDLKEVGRTLSIKVKVLCQEETWKNPSILLATLAGNNGKVVFSQIHLEADPTEYEDNDDTFKALEESNATRLEIISDLLSKHLEMEINNTKESIEYTPAYLLSQTENLKKELLKSLTDNTLQMPDLKIQFYTSEKIQETASENFLPIIMNDKVRPTKFSSENYYQNLKTKSLGQLVIYSDVLTSTMNATDARMTHGLAVIARQQTQGRGRYSNVWLSPLGCTMFTVQVHIDKNMILAKQISILQSIAAVAMVSAVRSLPGYEDLDLRIKWPNDIYVGKSTKIGGLIVYTRSDKSDYVCNIGAGINLSNSKPTTCINDVILRYNKQHKKELEELSCEKYLALVFNQLETLIKRVENSDIKYFYDLYYKYWLHEGASVKVIELTGEFRDATILGIDEFGFLIVRTCIEDVDADITVHPDRNSFDLLKGLIIPK